ncbi:MAG: EI24 domain-containing protein [Pseudomonadota bacterium]|nr:EI24 domain-containing protein [Pseudomonadota bacterium]
MKLFFDSFWRAAAYCVLPRVVMLSLLPLVLMAGLALGLGYLYWEPAIDAVRHAFDSFAALRSLSSWLDSAGMSGFKSVLAPMVVVFLTTPVIVVVCLLLVAAFMTPAMLNLVAERRFAGLERRHGGSFLGSAWGASWATGVALVALLVTVPFWFVFPPLVLVLPPLIWGWLTYRVMSYDVLAEHASADERRELLRRHRIRLLGMGILCGYLGAAPSLVWASGMLAIVLAPVLVPAAVWIYTLVFAFSALWFAHFTLAALRALRAERGPSAGLAPGRGQSPPGRADE